MKNLVAKMVGDKRDWKQMETRAAALPDEFGPAYADLKPILFRNSAAGDGMDAVEALQKVLDMFEDAAAHGKGVRDVVGVDVPAFCDSFLPASESYRAQVIDSFKKDLDRWV